MNSTTKFVYSSKLPNKNNLAKIVFSLIALMGTSYSVNTYANGGIVPDNYPNAALINEGREIFFNETFNGNGRTCGTCHLEDNNFTIDVKSIADLPANDPLFIAERGGNNPLGNHFEDPQLMHQLGLIKANTNGFHDLSHGYTMRSVPHLLAMRTSLTPPSDMANDGTNTSDGPPYERTGWSGDGAPNNGTLRDFTVGAITQHFPKTLSRENGIDFRLATDHELNAVDAFMLSLGRQKEFEDFKLIRLSNPRAEMGRKNYLGEGVSGKMNCNACHFNGGANTDPNFDFPSSVTPVAFEMTNRSFAPRVEELRDQPRDIIKGQRQPFDDGFGRDTNLFNVPTVIEAADTGPYFHANQVDTVEAMVSFYATKRHLWNGQVLPAIVELNGPQVANVAAFLRILNADENARSASDLLKRTRELSVINHRNINLKLAEAEIDDALEVLDVGSLHYTDAVRFFKTAKHNVQQGKTRNALTNLLSARNIMIDRSSVGLLSTHIPADVLGEGTVNPEKPTNAKGGSITWMFLLMSVLILRVNTRRKTLS